LRSHKSNRLFLLRLGNISVLRIDNPPINAISAEVVRELEVALAAFEKDTGARALVISCAGRTFVAGGDITEFDQLGFSPVPFNNVLALIEASSRPIVAALHGSVLGGGFELALACHWRVATDSAQFGFPEVKLGLLPGSLGTQRLPRLIGPEAALNMIASGCSVGAKAALEMGIVDQILPAPIEGSAISFAAKLIERGDKPERLSQRDARSAPVGFFDAEMAKARTKQVSYPAASAIVEAVQASELPFAGGAAVEARLFEELRGSRQSRALRHLFFAQRIAAKIPGLVNDVEMRRLDSVGVLGAGMMGRGIAMTFLNVGIPTVLVDTSQQALDDATAAIRAAYQASAAKGRIETTQVNERMDRLTVALSDSALGGCDLVIEAVYENLDLKKQVCERLGRICKHGAVIATNTSTLDVDTLAVASGRPADFVGMHFFSPAHVMRLLEVIRGAHTSPQVLATVMQLARRIGKVAVVSGVCYGFIGNRMAEVYMREAEFLMMEGAEPAEVDAAVESLGMAMGPCRMLDMAGIDVGAKTVIEYGKTGGLPPDPSYRCLVQKLFAIGRHGQKTAAGYYKYEGRKAIPDVQTTQIAQELAAEHGIVRRARIPQQEIVERLLYPMINEGTKILEEGIAYRPSDIDVIWTAGYGFPDHQGGPMFMADEIGLTTVFERLYHYARERGNRYGYWTPSRLLTALAAGDQRITDWKRES
jgi:3-hydroxyacyl-CoA dehydrogenase